MALSAEYWSNLKLVMVTSPYEWKILEWDVKSQRKKQYIENGTIEVVVFTDKQTRWDPA